MLSAVTVDNPNYEGLRDYITSAARPTGVSARNANARQPMSRPISSVPDAKRPIPTSSAKPYQQSNAKIVYTRVCTSFPEGMSPEHVMEGDVVFCHRFDGALSGHGTNRTSRVATLAQLNHVLASYQLPDNRPNGPHPDTSTNPDLGSLIMDAQYNPMGEQPPRTREELDTAARAAADAVQVPPVLDNAQYATWQAAYAAYLAPGGPGHADFAELLSYEADPLKYRWQHCRFLAEWCPDGVLLTNEHEHLKDPMVGNAASNPGEALNICIGGPTKMRNSDWGEFPQHFDDGIRVLDKIFVGLVAEEVLMPNAANNYFRYQWKLFTSRQLAWTQFVRPAAVNYAGDDTFQPGGNNKLGPTKDDFMRMVSVWRIGSCMDSRTGMLPYKCAGVNVVVEPWDIEKVAGEYNEFFGFSLALLRRGGAVLDRTNVALTAFIAGVNFAIEADLRAALTWLDSLSVDMGQIRADIRGWELADRSWKDQDELIFLTQTLNPPGEPNQLGGAARVVPKPSLLPPGATVRPMGFPQVGGGTHYYPAPSSDTVKLWNALENLGAPTLARWQAAQAALVPGGAPARPNQNLQDIGRMAMLTVDKQVYSSLTAAEQARVQQAERVHALATGLLSAMRVARVLREHDPRGFNANPVFGVAGPGPAPDFGWPIRQPGVP